MQPVRPAAGGESGGRGDNQQRYAISIHPTTGAISIVPVRCDYLHYLECHDLNPEGIESWSEGGIRELAGSAVPGYPQTWERALILLAHRKRAPSPAS